MEDGECLQMGLFEEENSDLETELEAAEEEPESCLLSISAEQARLNYEQAGKCVQEEPDRISVAGNAHWMESSIDALLDDVVAQIGMPYKPAEFQRVAINSLGQLENLVLISPTGSGKMNVPLLAALVLRKKFNNPQGVAIITQPLTSIMNEKRSNDICAAAVLSMKGELTTSKSDLADANLSCDLEDLLNGVYPAMFGHAESFDSPLGQHILRELLKRKRIILICVDEVHQGGSGHWDSFRKL